MSRLRLVIDSNLKDVVYVGLVVNKICEHLRMDPVSAGQIELCAVEAVTNAIRHAYGNQEGHDVTISLSIENDRLGIEIADTGTAMPASAQEQLRQGSDVLDFDPENHADLPEGGMGLQIMREVMDQVTYKKEEHGNTVQLIRLLCEVENERGREVSAPYRSADGRNGVLATAGVHAR
jgi:serine/threonine-protein kinase RsbW